MKWFSSRLFKESARTTRILNILYIIIAVIAAVSGPAYRMYLHRMGYELEGTLLRPDYFTSLLFWVVIIFNVAEIMRLFSYHFSRKASDFYHALPFTRHCFVITNVTLILLRDALAIGLALIFKVAFLKFDGTSVFPMTFPLVAFIYLMVVSLMVLSAMLVAISLSGTLVFAIVLGFLVLLLPRFVYMITLFFIGDMSGVMSTGFIPYFSERYNIIFHYMLNFGRGTINVYEGYNAAGILVSLGVALLTGIAAMVLFIRRKSEYAESAVPGAKTDFMMHILVTLVTALPMIGFGITSSETDVVVVLCILSLIFFTVYGLYRRKGVKGFFKTLPRLLAVAVICLIYAGFIAGVSYSVKNVEIKAENVKAVQIYYDDDGNMYVDDTSVYESYTGVAHHDVEYTDEEIIKLCVKGYNRRADSTNNMSDRYHYSTAYTVRFIMDDGKEYIRVITLAEDPSNRTGADTDEVTRLNELVLKDKERIRFDSSLPENELYSSIFESDERNQRIVEIFENEFKELSEKERIEINRENSYGMYGYGVYEGYDDSHYESEYESEYDSVNISFETYYNKTVPTRYFINLSKKTMPKTYKYYVESVIAEKKEALSTVNEFINSGEEGHSSISFGFNEDGTNYDYSVVFDRHGTFIHATLYIYEYEAGVATEGDAEEYVEDNYKETAYEIEDERAVEALKMFAKTYTLAKQDGHIDTFVDAEFYSSESLKEKTASDIPVTIDKAALKAAEDYFIKNGTDVSGDYY